MSARDIVSHAVDPGWGIRGDYEEWQRVLGMAISYVDGAQSILVNSSGLHEEYADHRLRPLGGPNGSSGAAFKALRLDCPI